MCNTPLRLYKQYAHEGGSSTPMIAHWPSGIKARGELTGFTSHLVDIMPTLVELSGAGYPKEVDGHAILAMEGVSLGRAFKGEQQRGDHPLYWDFNGNHAVRAGNWKLVAERGKGWELYDLAKDRSESKDVASEKSGQVVKLAPLYDAWAKRVGARTHAVAKALKPSKQSQLFDLDALLAEPQAD
jgi:arylsulfatase